MASNRFLRHSIPANGYINNLHPSHKELSEVIERVVWAFIPMFERVLTDLLPENFTIPFRVTMRGRYLMYGISGPPEPQWSQTNSDDVDNEERYQDRYINRRVILQPEPKQERIPVEERKAVYSLLGRSVQVIVKLANIVLVRHFYQRRLWLNSARSFACSRHTRSLTIPAVRGTSKA